MYELGLAIFIALLESLKVSAYCHGGMTELELLLKSNVSFVNLAGKLGIGVTVFRIFIQIYLLEFVRF